MTPKILKLFYEYLCKDCRYYWIYESRTLHCPECDNARFNKKCEYIPLELLYVSETSFTFTHHNIPVGPAIILLRPYDRKIILPNRLEQFDTYQEKIIILIGRFFNSKTFIYINELDIIDVSQYEYYYIGKPPTSN